MAKFYIKRNDTSPAIQTSLKDENKDPIDLTDCDVKFLMGRPGESPKVNASATIVDAPNGLVKYNWQPQDTDTEGTFYAEFEVTYPNSSKETFPNKDYISIYVASDIG